jgi:hypothetical protein
MLRSSRGLESSLDISTGKVCLLITGSGGISTTHGQPRRVNCGQVRGQPKVSQFEFDVFAMNLHRAYLLVRLFLTYQFGLRPKRHQYRRLEAIPRGQRLVQRCARRAQPGLEQIA